METKISYFLSGGPGGQRRDKKKTGVMVRHLSTGLTVRVEDQRSQSQNKKTALLILQKRLKLLRQRKKKRIPTRIPAWVKRQRVQEKKRLSEKKRWRKGGEDG
jgi:protein subunit release factor B